MSKTTLITDLELIDDDEVLKSIEDIKDLDKAILDFSNDEELRILCLDTKYEEIGNDCIEIISRINSMYQLSGTKSLEKFMTTICLKSNISVFLKLQVVKSLIFFEEDEEDEDEENEEDLQEIIMESNDKIFNRNNLRMKNAYSLLNIICKDPKDLSTPCKVEAVCILMNNKDWEDESLEYFINIINNQEIECDYRYKCIVNLENLNIEDWLHYTLISLYEFLHFPKNMTMYKILAAQYILQKEEVNIMKRNTTQKTLLSFAEDIHLDYNLRADASDTLMNLGDDFYKNKGREIIVELGQHFGKVRTVFDNAQNVHVDSIETSVMEALEFLSTVPTMTLGDIKDKNYITFEYVYGKIIELINDVRKACEQKCGLKEVDLQHECKHCDYCKNCYLHLPSENLKQHDENIFCNTECYLQHNKEKLIKVALNRINIDRALYSKYNQSLANIVIKLWSYMVEHEAFEDMKQRLLEELFEMSGTCSSGFASRLINVISGFGDFNVRISWDEQIVANFSGRLNALARNITKEGSLYYTDKHRDVVELYLRDIGIIKTKKEDKELDDKTTTNKIIDSFLKTDRDIKIKQAVEAFSENVLFEMTIETEDYTSRKNFAKFFRDHMLAIREELYEEFKDYITDTEFDLASRKAIASYEGMHRFI